MLAERTGYPITLEEAFAAQPTYASVFSMVEALKHKGVIEAEEEEQTHVACHQKNTTPSRSLGNIKGESQSRIIPTAASKTVHLRTI